MLHGMLITDNKETAELIGCLSRSSQQLVLDRVFCPSPGPYPLTIALNTLSLDVVFLAVSDPAQGFSLYRQIREKNATAAVVGFSAEPYQASADPTAFLLKPPYTVPNFLVTVRGAVEASHPLPHTNVVAIMPAKAGGGATTIAVNLASQLVGSFSRRVVVADCDLRSGTIADRLGLHAQQSIWQTLSLADASETLIWPQHICRKDDIDFLVTDRDRRMSRPEWHSYHHLLTFLSRRYDHVILDLPELVNDATAEAVRSASMVYVMTTPEVLSLALAKERLADLEFAQVGRSRIRILVNRRHPDDPSSQHISEFLGCPVGAVFPDDYRAANAATTAQSFVATNTHLGKSYLSFAEMLAGKKPSPEIKRDPSFLGAFFPRALALTAMRNR